MITLNCLWAKSNNSTRGQFEYDMSLCILFIYLFICLFIYLFIYFLFLFEFFYSHARCGCCMEQQSLLTFSSHAIKTG